VQALSIIVLLLFPRYASSGALAKYEIPSGELQSILATLADLNTQMAFVAECTTTDARTYLTSDPILPILPTDRLCNVIERSEEEDSSSSPAICVTSMVVGGIFCDALTRAAIITAPHVFCGGRRDTLVLMEQTYG
jgi:hypothetical protein